MTLDAFVTALWDGYHDLNQRPLRHTLLTSIISQLGNLFAQGSFTTATYDLFFVTCLKALNDFTDNIHPYCLEPVTSDAIFTETHFLNLCLFDYAKDGTKWRGTSQAAYQALALPFKAADIKALFPTVSTGPSYRVTDRGFTEDYPYDGTDTQKNAYRRRQDAYSEKLEKEEDKAREAAFDALICYQWPFVGTPLFNSVHSFIPYDEVQVPYVIPERTRFSGMWCLAPPGRGKTTLLTSLFIQDLHLVADDKASIIVIDSKGALLNDLKRLQLFAPGNILHGKLVLIEPDPDYPPAINPLDLADVDLSKLTPGQRSHAIDNAISHLEYLFSVLIPEQLSGPQQRYLRAILRAVLQTFPEPNIQDVENLLVHGYEKYEQYISQLPDRSFFSKEQFYSSNFKATRDSLISRVGLLLDRSILSSMFKSRRTRLKFTEELDAAKVIIVDNNWDKLSREGAEFFGRFFIYLLRQAAVRRMGRNVPRNHKLPVYVYLDEAHAVIFRDEIVNTIVTECRDQNIAMIFAHQSIEGQIDSRKVATALGLCAIKFFNSGTSERSQLAHFVDADRPPLTPMILDQPEGHFVVHVTDHKPNPRIIYVKQAPKLPLMTAAEEAAIKKEMRDKYCEPIVVPTKPVPNPPRQPDPPAPSSTPARPPTPPTPKGRKKKQW